MQGNDEENGERIEESMSVSTENIEDKGNQRIHEASNRKCKIPECLIKYFRCENGKYGRERGNG